MQGFSSRFFRRPTPVVALLVALALLVGCGTTATGPGTAQTAVGAASSKSTAPGNSQALPTAEPTLPGGGDAGGDTGGEEGSQPTAKASTDLCTRIAGRSDPGVTDTQIHVGVSGPLSGVTGFIGEEWIAGADSYFQMTNARGGICGRKIKFTIYDDNLNPSQTLTNMRKLYETDKVLMAFTPTGESVGDYVTRNNYPTIVFGINSVAFESKFPTMYPASGSALVWDSVLVKVVKAWHPKEFAGMKVAILYDNKMIDTTALVPYIKQFWQAEGAKVVSADALGPGDTDCTSLVLKMKQLGVQYWEFDSFGYIHCLGASQRQNWRPSVGWGGWPPSAPLLLQQTGPVAGTVDATSGSDRPDGYPRVRTAEGEAYQKALRLYHPNIGNNQTRMLSSVVSQGWMAGHLVVDALKGQGWRITRAGLNHWIQSVRDWNPIIGYPVHSMAPNCKGGAAEWIYIVKWGWDAKNRAIYQQKASQYTTNTYYRDKYGPCWLTLLANKINAR